MKAMEIAAKPINFILDSAIKKNNHASTIVVNSTIPRNKKNSIRYSKKLDQIKYGNKYDAPALQPNTIQSNINVNNGKKKNPILKPVKKDYLQYHEMIKKAVPGTPSSNKTQNYLNSLLYTPKNSNIKNR
jgi:hypothetical protein